MENKEVKGDVSNTLVDALIYTITESVDNGDKYFETEKRVRNVLGGFLPSYESQSPIPVPADSVWIDDSNTIMQMTIGRLEVNSFDEDRDHKPWLF